MAESEQGAYRKIMKSTSIFGGIQILQIIVQIIRSKFIAIYLGPFGVGISNLLGSTLNLINVLFNFSLTTISIKDIAQANSIKDENKINYLYAILTKLSIVLAGFGFLATIFCSNLLSNIVFGNSNYSIHFALLSLSIFFTQIILVKNSFLQGLQKVNLLAKVSIYSGILSLVFVLPLYKIYKLNSIVPSILVSSFITFLVTIFFTKKLKISKVDIDPAEVLKVSKQMLTGGIILTLSGVISHFTPFFIAIFIGKFGSVAEVGLYASGFALVNSYTGLVFSALAIDYHPRLSALADSLESFSKAINVQGEIAILLLSPLIVFLIIHIDQLIILLLTKEFKEAKIMVLGALIGVFLKASSWSISFNFVARGKNRLFFWNELAANIYNLLFAMGSFFVLGINGLGISFILTYFIYFLQVYVISKNDFSFRFNKTFVQILITHISVSVLAVFFSNDVYYKVPRSFDYVLLILSIFLSVYSLNKRMNLIELLKLKLKL